MKPVKPTKDTLSRSYILQAALAFLDRENLQNFTMRKLGSEMGVSPMAVYRYFPNQGALFDGLVELIWQKALIMKSNSKNSSWQEQAISLMSQLRQTLSDHPHVLSLISTHPLVTQSEFILAEKILTNLVEKGLEIHSTTVFLINSLTVYTLGFVWAEAVEPKDGGEVDPKLLKDLQDHSDILDQLMKPIQNNQFTSDQQFLMGINAILNGWE
ncbi:MAG: TetR/AcrR family transcriptional regulator [Lentilactobacillus hilgardii]|uniref:TetR/AcrR family transcriptional regulator n=1 Tax=Lentilactobacillus hilgardii TaxID=1588 RepID=UPI001CC1C349|nr:TetR/AcrR family transcriptional regulator [Lentilactobacillus hilgardii]MBZ2201934.1 TetR family transcriptional regulator [Lentilactobacillus hilgardii]MBZ2204129.1 TetR/AcrR family transcriptional regulator [Lentilactobacillus hilgardii]